MELPAWMPDLIWWGTGLSLVTLVATLVAVPWVVGRLPVDYFCQTHRAVLPQDRSFPGLLLMGAKNLLGAFLVLLGLFWAALSLAFSPRMKHWWKIMPLEQHEK